MLKIGSLVDGKYRVLSEIGHGGMSVVYMAINEKANKTWAIKEVRKDGVKDFEVVRQGLIVETEMLKRLDHPNLPSIVDVIENEDTFLIVMDYIEGNPLSQALEEYGAQPQEFVIEWAKQLCDVLDYLHTRNPAIIYRDMKPANIMLKPDGNITLIDFGTAREFKEKILPIQHVSARSDMRHLSSLAEWDRPMQEQIFIASEQRFIILLRVAIRVSRRMRYCLSDQSIHNFQADLRE